MASKTTEYVEELNKLDEELRQNQLLLADTLNLNEDLTIQIEKKEKDIVAKEARLVKAREKNAAELEQYQLEYNALIDRLQHEAVHHVNIIRQLEMKKIRYEGTEAENLALFESIQSLSDKIAEDRKLHANAMHDMNKNLRQLRVQMEEKFRKELMNMDISYQREAFHALLEDKKKAMYQNAKLKDEVSLQGVGMANLSARLGKQNYSYEKCQRDLKSLHRKSKRLREELIALTIEKSSFQNSERELKLEREHMAGELDRLRVSEETGRSREAILSDIRETYSRLSHEEGSILALEQRIDRLQQLSQDIKPLTSEERKGHYQAKEFPINVADNQLVVEARERLLEELMDGGPVEEGSVVEGQAIHTKTMATMKSMKEHYLYASKRSNEPSNGVKPLELQYILSHDQALADALRPIQGKESLLLPTQYGLEEIEQRGEGGGRSGGKRSPSNPSKPSSPKRPSTAAGDGEPNQNMVAWTALQILQLWFETESVRTDYEKTAHDAFEQLLHTKTSQTVTEATKVSAREDAVHYESVLEQSAPSDVPSQPIEKLSLGLEEELRPLGMVDKTKEWDRIENGELGSDEIDDLWDDVMKSAELSMSSMPLLQSAPPSSSSHAWWRQQQSPSSNGPMGSDVNEMLLVSAASKPSIRRPFIPMRNPNEAEIGPPTSNMPNQQQQRLTSFAFPSSSSSISDNGDSGELLSIKKRSLRLGTRKHANMPVDSNNSDILKARDPLTAKLKGRSRNSNSLTSLHDPKSSFSMDMKTSHSAKTLGNLTERASGVDSNVGLLTHSKYEIHHRQLLSAQGLL